MVPAYFSVHEEADGEGDIEATLRLDFGGVHAGGEGRPGHGLGMGCPQKEKEYGGTPASQSPANQCVEVVILMFTTTTINTKQ